MSQPIVNDDSARSAQAVPDGSASVYVESPQAIALRRAILILGMHRSGTSALTKVLHLCGLDLSATLVPGRADNELGFFEPGKVVGIHEEMFRVLGSSWDDPGGIPVSKLTGTETADYRRRLLEALREDLGESRQFVIKDPRFCRLLPMWKMILAEFGAEPLCILTIRNPLDIAASLQARDQFSNDKSLWLWLRHFLDSERHTRDLRRTFVSYDALLENWQATIRRINEDLSLGLDEPDAQTEKEVREFLQPSLRHHRHEAKTLQESDTFRAVWRVYAWVERAINGQTVDSAELDEIAAEIDRVAGIFTPVIDAQRDAKKQADLAAGEHAKLMTAQVEQTEETLHEFEQARREAENVAAESKRRIEAIEQQVADAKRRNEELYARQLAGEAMSEKLTHEVTKLKSDLARAAANGERLSEQLAAKDVELDQARVEIARGQATAARHAAESARTQQQLDAELAERDRIQRVGAAGQEELTAARRQVEQIHASLSWRMTAPFRHGGKVMHEVMPKVKVVAAKVLRNKEVLRTRRRVAASGLFDGNYYLSRYPEVAAAGMDPLDHYILYGAAQARDPHPLFHAGFYLRKYPEVAATKLNPLLHYVDFGAAERRSPNQLFDSSYYLERYPDVAAAGVNPLQHYCDSGWTENRNPHPLFDGAFYLRRYPEVAKAKLNPLLHYLRWGQSDRRSPNPWFDVRWYLERYPDVAAAGIDALEHYLLRGAIEGRDAGPVFCTNYYVQEHPWLTEAGINPLVHWVTELASGRARERYWNRPTALRRNLRPVRDDGAAAVAVAALKTRPLISILIPTFNTPSKYLLAAAESVRAQTYPNWELCICDDGSHDETTLATLRELELDAKKRIRVSYRSENGGISRASNDALAMARGDFVAMLDHDDEILPDALLRFVQSIDEDPEVDVLYSDQAFLSVDGEEEEPLLKPDWSPRLLWGVMYVGHLLMVRRELAKEVGGFDPQFDNVQDFEFMLRLGEKTQRIRHIPEILYYWRRVHGSVSRQADAKSGIPALQARAVNEHLKRMKIAAAAQPEGRHAHRLMVGPTTEAAKPSVSIFVRPSGNAAALDRCLDSILSKTRYADIQVFVIGDSIAPDALGRFGGKVKTLASDPVLGKADVTEQFPGEFWVSMSAEMEIVSPDWLEQLVFAASLPGAMYVCPLVLQAMGAAVEEAGLILGLDGSVGPAMRGWLAESDGHAGSLTCLREVSAVSDMCVAASRKTAMMRATDEEAYQSGWHRMAHRSAQLSGKSGSNLFVPRAILRRTANGVTAEDAMRLDAMLFADLCHGTIEKGDPFHNLNFSRIGSGYQ